MQHKCNRTADTMAFSHSNYTDASRSTFNDVGHDQTFNNNVRINHATISICLSGSGQTLQLLGPTAGPGTLLQSVPVPTYHPSAIVSAVDIAVGLIVNIVRLLLTESSDGHRHLERELKSLCQSLILTRSAIQVYEYTPLGQSLANTIHPEIGRCHAVLQETLDKIVHCRESLKSTSIGGLWFQVWWSTWDGDELASSRIKLAARQETLNEFLMALNSYVLIFRTSAPAKTSHSVINKHSVAWMDLGNELRTSHVSIERFSASLRQRLLPLRHIQINKVLVVDHLGRNLPVPTLFCSTWKVDLILSIYWSGHTAWQARILTISSTAIAMIASEIASSSAVTIK